jgi:hypothetical protein
MKKADDPKAFAAAQAKYCDMMDAGQGVKVALEATGLSHSQGDWAWYGDPRNKDFVEPGSITLPAIPAKGDEGYEVALRRRGLAVAEARNGEHPAHSGRQLSWGQIAVAANVPETAVRRAFTATGIDSAGTRKGRGGRWLADEPRMYLGNRKGIGLEAPNPRAVALASLEKDKDSVKSVLPQRIEALKKTLGGQVTKRARKTVPVKKAVAKRTKAA